MADTQPYGLGANHDEGARDMFVLGLKRHINLGLAPGLKSVYEKRARPAFEKAAGRPFRNRHEVRKQMLQEDYFQVWGSLWRTAQGLMWESAEDKTFRQMPDLIERARKMKNKKGSLRTDANLKVPGYVGDVDIHGQPGGYGYDLGGDDITAGLLYESAGGIYGRGQGISGEEKPAQAIISFVKNRFPDLKVKRMLDEGCSSGGSEPIYCAAYPDADIHAIDVSAGMIRYAHAKMEARGLAVHFSQQNAEATGFPDNHFDLIVSNIMLHETSAKAVPQIFKESARILRKGGVMVHMDVPVRYRDLPLYDQVIRGWQTRYNDEPFWDGVCSADLETMAKAAGFAEVRCGYVPKSDDPVKSPSRITQVPNQGPDWRFVVTARK